ncbi:MAG: WXG100 family type VII secretion target [Coriobacteriales bacterium]|jgi:WXG100 family type VII secretion target|nr:WXG100 family type VII secretion target [Coriobacteriales bacterium]
MASNQVETVNTSYFDQAVSDLDKAVSTFSASKTKALGATDQLLGTWKGEGRNSFEKTYNKLKQEMDDDLENLKAIQENLQAIKESYVGWDGSLASQMTEA